MGRKASDFIEACIGGLGAKHRTKPRMKLVSACLIGISCNYRGESSYNEEVFEEFKTGNMYPICPEILGGLPTPRAAAEIRYGSSSDVLDGKARVVTREGEDVTDALIKGAYMVLEIARSIGAKEAVLKARSPSCGCGKIYDGTFSGNMVDGDGVTAGLLKRNGIEVMTDNDV